jgi:hypothetical protein
MNRILLTVIALCSLSAAQTVTVPQGTEIRLRLSQNVSSADAHVGDRVSLEVLEDVSIAGVVTIHRGAPAAGVVTVAHEKRRMGRPGAVTIRVESVQAVDGSSVAVDTVRKQKGGNGALKMGVTALIAGPFIAPAVLLFHGHDTTIEAGTPVSVFSVIDSAVGAAKAPVVQAAVVVPVQAVKAAASQEHVIEGYTISSATSDAASAPGSQLSLADVARAAKAKREKQ